MPRNIPPNPDFTAAGSDAEKHVWAALQGLPTEAVVISQYHLTDGRRMYEADFIVLIPGVGVGILEVKGGRVSKVDGQWTSRDRYGRDHDIKNPIQQASDTGYQMARFLYQQGIRVPQWTAVAVVPDTALPAGFQTPDASPNQWIGRDQMSDIVGRLNAALYSEQAPGGAEVEAVVRALEQDLPRPRDWQKAEDGRRHADILTREQYAILRAVRSNDRILVTGGPGTGKTWLALEHARQETLRGARVAMLCYNRGLAVDLQRRALAWPQDERPALIGTLHEVAVDWTGTDVPADADSAFWDGLPAALQVAAAQVDDRFDLVIVDEAQDIREQWWPAVLSLMEDPEAGPLVAFGDEDQELYGRGVFGLPAFEVTLEENIRNTVQIAEVLQRVTGEEQTCRGASGPEPVFIECPQEAVMQAADQAVEALLQGGQYRPEDIAVLTTHRRHPEHSRRLAELGPVGFAESLIGTDVAYCTVKGFKGLERPAVVLAVNGFHEQDERENLLRVGVSRACHQLVVVGMGGVDVD